MRILILVAFFLSSVLNVLSSVASANPYTFDPSDLQANGSVMMAFTRSDGAVVKLYDVDRDGVIASTGSDCVIEVDGQRYDAPHDNDDGGTRCIAVPKGGVAEIYVFPNSALGIPFATEVMRFDGYWFERVAGVGKRLMSPLVHVRYNLQAYLASVAILGTIGLIVWGLFKITPKRKRWWLLHGVWFAAGGMVILSYLGLMAMGGNHSLLIPFVILGTAVVCVRMAWKLRHGGDWPRTLLELNAFSTAGATMQGHKKNNVSECAIKHNVGIWPRYA